jgi:hypothetical protein
MNKSIFLWAIRENEHVLLIFSIKYVSLMSWTTTLIKMNHFHVIVVLCLSLKTSVSNMLFVSFIVNQLKNDEYTIQLSINFLDRLVCFSSSSIFMFRMWHRHVSISTRSIHTVVKQSHTNDKKKKVIVLGAGWYVWISLTCCWSHDTATDISRGGFQFVRYLNRTKYDVTLVR